jgi:ParB/RepB/Spo0J family partition protein
MHAIEAAADGTVTTLTANFDADSIVQIPISQIVESPFNPRKIYRNMEDMEASVQADGVRQPVLVRPWRGAPESPGTEIIGYELVFGHRRYRAARAVGLVHLPAMVEEMDDLEARRLQQIENVQREDLDAIDEAEGFKSYMEAFGLNAKAMADQLKKSRTHVFNRLKLITLCEPGREMVRTKVLGAETGTRVARLSTIALQEKALGEIARQVPLESGGFEWVVMSHREAVAHIDRNYSRHLANAIFDRVDIALVVDAPACAGCEHRLGNMEENVSAVRADICTKPDCFDAKTSAHLRNVAAKAAEHGGEVVQGDDARKLLAFHGGLQYDNGLRDLDSTNPWDLDDLKAEGAATPRHALGKKLKPADIVHIVHPATGNVITAVRDATLVKYKLIDEPEPEPTDVERAERTRQQRQTADQNRKQHEISNMLQERQAEIMLTMVNSVPRTALDLVYIAWRLLAIVAESERFHAWLAEGWPGVASQFKPGYVYGDEGKEREQTLYAWLRTLDADTLAQACLVFALLAEISESPDSAGGLPDLCRAYGIDPDKMARDVEAEVDAAGA